MGQLNDLQNLVTKTHVAEVVQHGDKLTVPAGMSLNDAIDLLQRRAEYMEKLVSFSRTYNYFLLDGAAALQRVIARRYGWVEQMATEGFFGPQPPKMITVESGPNGKTITVPWGTIHLPNVNGMLITSHEFREGFLCFRLVAEVRRMDEDNIRTLMDELEVELRNNSIYRGQVIKIRFKAESGDRLEMPWPQFIDPYEVDEGQLVYSDSVQAAVETSLFTPITRVKDCLNNGIPVKRGILLGGTFGTGKTLAAKVAARLAAENGITFLYAPRADELADAIAFAKTYQSPACVVFCEDIDRVLEGDRSVEMDDILNIIDGIDTKSSNIIVVLTTNNLLGINAAMLRPGRLDAVIEVTPPDAKAVERMIRYYGNGLIPPTASLQRAGEKLNGCIPAVIAEVVKRAKLAELKRVAVGCPIVTLSEDSILESAETMAMQLKLLNERNNAPKEVPELEASFKTAVMAALTEWQAM